MKQNILIIIIVVSQFLFFIKTSNAQNFLVQDKIWSDYYHSDRYDLYNENGQYLGWTTAKVTTWHKIGIDSIIEGTPYKQILSSRNLLMENWHLEALMREEGDKVFQYDSYEEREVLLYDFGMQPGDTLFDRNGLVATVLQSVHDTIMDRTRKIFTFSKYAYDYSSQKYDNNWEVEEEIWIEGIGALRGGIFRPLYDYSTGGDYSIGYRGLICYFENGELVYHNTDFDECYYDEIKPLPDSYIPEKKSQIYVLSQNVPNPFTSQSEIKCFVAADMKEAYVSIFDMQGIVLQKIGVAPGQNSVIIQGATLTAGVYLYSLIADGQVVDVKRMILTE